MEWAVFVIFAVAALGGAGGVVMARKPVHAALSLVLTRFSVDVQMFTSTFDSNPVSSVDRARCARLGTTTAAARRSTRRVAGR